MSDQGLTESVAALTAHLQGVWDELDCKLEKAAAADRAALAASLRAEDELQSRDAVSEEDLAHLGNLKATFKRTHAAYESVADVMTVVGSAMDQLKRLAPSEPPSKRRRVK